MTDISDTAAGELWHAAEDASENTTVTLPSGAAPGTRVVVRRTDLGGRGTLTVLASGDDTFGGGEKALVLAVPAQECHLEYHLMPADGKRETEGVWYLVEEGDPR